MWTNVPYGPEIEPSEDRQGEFLEIKYAGILRKCRSTVSQKCESGTNR